MKYFYIYINNFCKSFTLLSIGARILSWIYDGEFSNIHDVFIYPLSFSFVMTFVFLFAQKHKWGQ
jgi:hypothetical protein